MPSLERFRKAQEGPGSGYEVALAEMRAGRKRGHWIWYIFPQLSGLGASSMSRAYGIDGIAEAEQYLRDPILGGRLLTCAATVADRVRDGIPLQTLMGSSIDVQKLVSSLTLFGRIAGRLFRAEGDDSYRSLAEAAEEILAAAALQGYAGCEFTRTRLEE